ncbi:MAG TPA: hydrogenase small subunit [Streptosporangiaceae bacterium]|nr:hydrogenase small subunit [Streptosporangiaceae bacterium]
MTRRGSGLTQDPARDTAGATIDTGRAPAEPPSVAALLERDGVGRRSFLQWCGFIAGVLALPADPFGERIAHALTTQPRLPVLWLNGQDCNGNIEGFLRASDPTPSELVLDRLSIDYVELLMAPSGTAAENQRADTIARFAGRYVLVVEGSVPTAGDGAFCCIGGKAFTQVVEEAAGDALAVIGVGSCAFDGGLPAARGGVTGAVGIREFLSGSGKTIITLPGCPMNVDNLTATLVHYLTFGTWPELDELGRPEFAYGSCVHELCDRRRHYRAGRFVLEWGDEGHQQGWCLLKMGCLGPGTPANCPTARFNSGTSWPVASGAPCLGCTRPKFWDNLSRAFPAAPASSSSSSSSQGT